MPLYLWNGKLLVDNGQLANSIDCCCVFPFCHPSGACSTQPNIKVTITGITEGNCGPLCEDSNKTYGLLFGKGGSGFIPCELGFQPPCTWYREIPGGFFCYSGIQIYLCINCSLTKVQALLKIGGVGANHLHRWQKNIAEGASFPIFFNAGDLIEDTEDAGACVLPDTISFSL